jgi:hypothetical protein
MANGSNATVAAKHAIDAADTAGNLWFNASAGTLVRASLSSPNTSTSYDGATTGAASSSAPPNFSATVTVTGTYPPIFDPIFQSKANWVYASNASATTSYAYAQILLMLDTSGSMLIGADPPDILTLEEGTVCPQQGYVVASDGSNFVAGNHSLGYGDYLPGSVPPGAKMVPLSSIAAYSGASDSDITGHCNPVGGKKYGLLSPTKYEDNVGGTAAGTPCALACHFSTATAPNGLPADYYGLARAENVTLRLDVLFGATEQVISDMQNSEAVANQLSVGVYQFNTDVFPIVTGATGTGGTLPEATSDLASALAAVDAVDYKKTPGENVIPQLINFKTVSTTPSQSVANIGGDTNFPKSLADLQAGNAFALDAAGHEQPLTANGTGATSATPLKFMFIVTDGLEDDSASNGDGNANPAHNVEGEMTSIAGETANNLTSGTCAYLKNSLGYTVYVLYVDYYPLANTSYYQAPTPGIRYTNSATNGDYPADINASVETITYTPAIDTSPTAEALQACASSPTYFKEASSSADIQNDLAAMLKAALASTIRLTN